MVGWFRDARYAVRQMMKAPAFALTAIVTIALGVGANSTIFTWMNSTLFSPIPGAHAKGTLITFRQNDDLNISYPDYVDLRDHSRSFSGLIAWDTNRVDLTGTEKPVQMWVALTSANYFDALGVRPLMGRFFAPQEGQKEGGAPVVVLGYRTWQLLFSGDPAIVGRTINLNQHPYTVIGVAPALFEGAATGLRMDIWVPLMMQAQLEAHNILHERGDGSLQAMGVLQPGVSRQQAERELNVEMQQLKQAWPDDHLGKNSVETFPLWRAPETANGYLYRIFPVLMALAGVVLLLACVNVANLFLVRAVARRREMAVRLSLGANRSRIVRQLLVESLLIALAGGAVALYVTTWSARSFGSFLPPTDLPIALDMRVDGRVLLMTFLVAALSGIAFGLLPALRSARVAPGAVLKEESGTASGGRHKARLTSALVTVQIALSFLLLVCGGLFIRSFRNAQHADVGFQPDHVLLSSVDLFPAGYTAEMGLAFQRELLRRVEQIPGVKVASFSEWSPLSFRNDTDLAIPEGYVAQKDESLDMLRQKVGPRYFESMGIPLAAGRDVLATDTAETQRVIVVNETFAKRYWPGQNAIGRRVRLYPDWYTVTGVARDSKYQGMNEKPVPLVYTAAMQGYRSNFILDVLVNGNPKNFAGPVADAVHSLNADLPVLDQFPLTRNVELASMGTRIAGTFVGMFGLVGLALAAIGIYGVIAYSARQRVHEIGIRLALGAKRRDVFELVLKQGLRLTITGMAVGLAGSLAVTPLLRHMLVGVATTDIVVYCCVGFALMCVALAACFIPAQRASSVDPIRALRYE
jgi:predicted permease